MIISPIAAALNLFGNNNDARAAAGVEALTPTRIRHCIDAVCDRANAEEDCWMFRRASESDLAKARLERAGVGTVSVAENAEGGTEEGRLTAPSLLYGILATASANEATDARLSHAALATFYLSYNTWDGRVMCVDCVNPGRGRPNSPSSTANNPARSEPHLLEPVLRRCLARIAVLLHCHELSWQHWGEPSEVEDDTTVDPPRAFTCGDASTMAASVAVVPRPEHLKGWLTLHWTAAAMRDFLGRQGSLPPSLLHPASTSSTDVRDTILRALEVLSQQQRLGAEGPPRFQVRLASAADVDAIGRLVQGLANFEFKPDAVHLTTEDYLRDGFGSDGPRLFYCLLLDDAMPIGGVRNSVVPHTCGIALCMLHERLHDDGRCLFLEDLFIEEPHRGGGAGRSVMTALGTVALSLQCSNMAWQTLHWNTPSLTFYEKQGAQVQDGLETLQYSGQTLVEFADWYCSERRSLLRLVRNCGLNPPRKPS